MRKSRVRAWVRSRVEKEDAEGGTPTDLWLARFTGGIVEQLAGNIFFYAAACIVYSCKSLYKMSRDARPRFGNFNFTLRRRYISPTVSSDKSSIGFVQIFSDTPYKLTAVIRVIQLIFGAMEVQGAY